MLTIKVNREAQTQEHAFDDKAIKTWERMLQVIGRAIRHTERMQEVGSGPNPDGVTIVGHGDGITCDDYLDYLLIAKLWAEENRQMAIMRAMQEQAQRQMSAQAIMQQMGGRPSGGGRIIGRG